VKGIAMRVSELVTPATTLRVRIEYPTLTPAGVYARWTQPDLLCRWWPETANLDARAGGAYTLGWPAMGWRLHGMYLAVIPNRELRFTWSWEHEQADERMVSIRFQSLATGGTALELEHGPYAETPEDQETRIKSHLAGWRHFLPRLDGF
jgi:uncharacterized protein YndB with AHSA1/START domain